MTGFGTSERATPARDRVAIEPARQARQVLPCEPLGNTVFVAPLPSGRPDIVTPARSVCLQRRNWSTV